MVNWKSRFEEVIHEHEGLDSPAAIRAQELREALFEHILDRVNEINKELVGSNLKLEICDQRSEPQNITIAIDMISNLTESYSKQVNFHEEP